MVDFTGGTWRSLIDGSEVIAIPDIVAEYLIDDGSGGTFADNIGDADGNVNESQWVSDEDLEGGFGLETDREIENAYLNVPTDEQPDISDEGTVAFTAILLDWTPSTGSLGNLFAHNGGEDRTSVNIRDDEEFTAEILGQQIGDAFEGDLNTPYRHVISWEDGSASYDVNAGEEHSATGSYDGSVDLNQTDWFWGVMSSLEGNRVSAILGSCRFADYQWTQDDKESDFDNLKWS